MDHIRDHTILPRRIEKLRKQTLLQRGERDAPQATGQRCAEKGEEEGCNSLNEAPRILVLGFSGRLFRRERVREYGVRRLEDRNYVFGCLEFAPLARFSNMVTLLFVTVGLLLLAMVLSPRARKIFTWKQIFLFRLPVIIPVAFPFLLFTFSLVAYGLSTQSMVHHIVDFEAAIRDLVSLRALFTLRWGATVTSALPAILSGAVIIVGGLLANLTHYSEPLTGP